MVVVLDTVRADRLSTYGHSRPTSSQLTAIAEAGVLFTDVTAPSPWTWPSHASLFTGLFPWEHGAHWASDPAQAIRFPKSLEERGEGWSLTPLRPEVPTLAELFSAAGYRSVSYSSNCLLLPELGLMRGFHVSRCEENDARTVEKAAEELGADSEKPLFLFVNLLSAHGPYLVAENIPWSAKHKDAFDSTGSPLTWAKPYLDPKFGPGLNLQLYPTGQVLNGEMAYAAGQLEIPEEDLPRISDLYDGDLLRLDHGMLTLVEAWNQRGLGNILAVTSDHGEYLGEHQRIGHGLDLYPEVLQVPLVIAAPGRLPQGKQVEAPVSLHRLGATLLEVAGVSSTVSAFSKSSSLLRIDEGFGEEHQLAAVWGSEFWGEHIAKGYATGKRYLRKGSKVAIVDGSGRSILFDYNKDSRQLDPLSDPDPEFLAEANKILAPTFVEAPRQESAPSISEEAEERLKSLGYVE
jgi:arylsulfatase A-like enzyme